MNVSVDGGKYTVQISDDGKMRALRHGEPWRDLTGDNLVYNLAYELNDARERLQAIRDLLDEAPK